MPGREKSAGKTLELNKTAGPRYRKRTNLAPPHLYENIQEPKRTQRRKINS